MMMMGGGWSQYRLHPAPINTWHALRPTRLEKKSLSRQIHSLSLFITNLSLPLVVRVSLYVKECGLCANSLCESQSAMVIAMEQDKHLVDLEIVYS